jgi:Flp pilus assembly protein TadB
MKTLFITCLCSVALVWPVVGQSPTVPPSPAGVAGAGSAVSPALSVSPSPNAQSDWQQKMEKKRKKGINFTIDGDDGEESGSITHSTDDIPEMVVPIVAVTMLTVFGAPVLIVGLIMYFGFSRNRMMHKTIRMMVEKGQEVPAALLVPPQPAVRQRSDMRRGVVLVMVGVGLMLFFAAVSGWDGGSWAIGVIPFVIGLGYLLVWKLEGKKDNPPPLP